VALAAPCHRDKKCGHDDLSRRSDFPSHRFLRPLRLYGFARKQLDRPLAQAETDHRLRLLALPECLVLEVFAVTGVLSSSLYSVDFACCISYLRSAAFELFGETTPPLITMEPAIPAVLFM
jgi:hypothetical protein